jgi:signal transduction histidine kinase
MGPTRRWRAPLAAFLVAVALAAPLAVWAFLRERDSHIDGLAADGRATSIAIESAVDRALEQAQAVAALFRASTSVTDAEFASFVHDLGFTAGMFGIGYVPIVEASEFDAFQAQLAVDHPGSFVFELDGLQPVPRTEQAEYHPIEFFVSPEDLPAWGFDVGSDPVFDGTLHASLIGTDPLASPFLWFPGRPDADGFVLFQPLVDDGVLMGSVAAALDLSDLLAAVGPASSGHIMGLPRVFDAAMVSDGVAADWVGEITVADRTWLVALDHTGSSAYMVAAFVLGIGLVAASALAVAVAAVGERLRQRREVEELRILDRQKDEFLATVSHELRTPLTSVMGFADELVDTGDRLSAAERHGMLRHIADESHAMEGIVQDLLAASRIEQGSSVPVASERISDLAAEVEALAVGRHTARTTSGPEPIAVMADPARVRQIIRNLLENAVRHGAAPIEVTVSRRDAAVDLTVLDGGPGVPESIQTSLFDRYRSASREASQPASTGIGLWVSRELARVMGGDLTWVPSPRGACFVLTLPAAAAIDPAQAVGF